jgi:hypothetical protein
LRHRNRVPFSTHPAFELAQMCSVPISARPRSQRVAHLGRHSLSQRHRGRRRARSCGCQQGDRRGAKGRFAIGRQDYLVGDGEYGSRSCKGCQCTMCRMRSACCARATSGHAAAPPRSVIKSRRFKLSMGTSSPMRYRAADWPVPSLSHFQPAARRPASPWGRPELF